MAKVWPMAHTFKVEGPYHQVNRTKWLQPIQKKKKNIPVKFHQNSMGRFASPPRNLTTPRGLLFQGTVSTGQSWWEGAPPGHTGEGEGDLIKVDGPPAGLILREKLTETNGFAMVGSRKYRGFNWNNPSLQLWDWQGWWLWMDMEWHGWKFNQGSPRWEGWTSDWA